jgi:citronellol/citronellal dehydrogenase
MANSAYVVLTSNSKINTGNFYIDEEVLKAAGVTNFEQYKVDKTVPDDQLMLDFFL